MHTAGCGASTCTRCRVPSRWRTGMCWCTCRRACARLRGRQRCAGPAHPTPRQQYSRPKTAIYVVDGAGLRRLRWTAQARGMDTGPPRAHDATRRSRAALQRGKQHGAHLPRGSLRRAGEPLALRRTLARGLGSGSGSRLMGPPQGPLQRRTGAASVHCRGGFGRGCRGQGRGRAHVQHLLRRHPSAGSYHVRSASARGAAGRSSSAGRPCLSYPAFKQ